MPARFAHPQRWNIQYCELAVVNYEIAGSEAVYYTHVKQSCAWLLCRGVHTVSVSWLWDVGRCVWKTVTFLKDNGRLRMSASAGKSQCFNAHHCSGGFPRFFSLLPGRTGEVRTTEVCLSSHSEGASDLSFPIWSFSVCYSVRFPLSAVISLNTWCLMPPLH